MNTRTLTEIIAAIHQRAERIKTIHPTLTEFDKLRLLGPQLSIGECLALADAARRRDRETITIGPYVLLRDTQRTGEMIIVDATGGGVESMNTDEGKLAAHIAEYYAREF